MSKCKPEHMIDVYVAVSLSKPYMMKNHLQWFLKWWFECNYYHYLRLTACLVSVLHTCCKH